MNPDYYTAGYIASSLEPREEEEEEVYPGWYPIKDRFHGSLRFINWPPVFIRFRACDDPREYAPRPYTGDRQ